MRPWRILAILSIAAGCEAGADSILHPVSPSEARSRERILLLSWGSAAEVLGMPIDEAVAIRSKYRSARNVEEIEESAVAQNDAAAMTLVGFIYAGAAKRSDTSSLKAGSLCARAAEQQYSYGQLCLGKIYLFGVPPGYPKDLQQAARLLKLAADQGLPEALLNYGSMYYAGDIPGQPRDVGEAARLFKVAADRGYARAQYSLGRLNYNGEIPGAPKNFAEAYRLYKLAAEQSEPQAQYCVGEMIYKGEVPGTPRNDAEAIRWFMLSANQRNPSAQFIVGQLFLSGGVSGVVKNVPEGYRLVRDSANQRNADALSAVGLLYLDGDPAGTGIRQDRVAAYRLFQAAAPQGSGAAQYNLAVMRSNGEIPGEGQPTATGARLYSVEAALAIEEAKQVLQDVEFLKFVASSYRVVRTPESDSRAAEVEARIAQLCRDPVRKCD